MYNKTYVIPGLLIFLILALSPFLLNTGVSVELPASVMENHPYPADEKLKMGEWKTTHMSYVDAESVKKCRGCHTEVFCKSCHDYVGVAPSIPT